MAGGGTWFGLGAERRDDAAKFREAAKPPRDRIARGAAAAEIADHLLPVIGAEHDAVAAVAPRVLGEKLAQHRHHVDVALQMRRLVEAARIGLALGGTQMRKRDTRREA